MAEKYRYMKKDFGKLPVKIRHLTIYLNFIDDRVEATGTIEMTAGSDMRNLVLNATGLKMLGVESCEGPDSQGSGLDYVHDKEGNKLRISLGRTVKKGEKFSIRTRNHCFPSENVLKGIYKDTTPKGAPQQYMSQCEMWGFQRIMPIIDDPRAKCTMTTTIEADARYTHLISNGNVSRKTNPSGKPVTKEGDKTRKVITYENSIPMSPYLFIAAVGTWDELADSVTYPSGKKVRLEYLVPPGRKVEARTPMEILKKSVLWIREKQDYEYPLEVYRTITMNKSDAGGMENLGNTTIITDAALIDEHTVDGLLTYAYQVIVHEFEHNQCGSEVTMETPFDMWLNEAYTVDVERQFSAEQFNPAIIRIGQVDGLRGPLLGPLVMEDSGTAGRIVRDGFNDPDELIDGVTYEKAAEVIRMLRLVIGEKAFRKGKTDYFRKYHEGNANNDQFFECFEKASGQDLGQFKEGWLYRIGYPKVTASTDYDAEGKRFMIRFRQECNGKPFHVPIELALVDAGGKDLPGTGRVFRLRENEDELVIENVKERPAFASLNRDYSFYGTFRQEMTREERMMQVEKDPNLFNRSEAMNELIEIQRLRIMDDTGAGIDKWWLDLFGKVLKSRIPNSLKANLIFIDEIPRDRDKIAWYHERVAAREKIMRAVNKAYWKDIVSLFKGIDTYGKGPLEKGIEDRMLKSVLLGFIALEDTPESHAIIEEHFRRATTATDRVGSLVAMNRSSYPKRRNVLEEVYGKWNDHISGYANYLKIISNGSNDDVWEMIENEKKRKTMDITQPTFARSLIIPMAYNTKMAWTDKGMRWIRDNVIEFSGINTTLSQRLLNSFQLVRKMKPDLRKKVIEHLRAIEKGCRKNPAVSGQARRYLETVKGI